MNNSGKLLLCSVSTVGSERAAQRINVGTSKGSQRASIGCRYYNRCNEKLAICSEKEPEFIEYVKGHFVACHLYNI